MDENRLQKCIYECMITRFLGFRTETEDLFRISSRVLSVILQNIFYQWYHKDYKHHPIYLTWRKNSFPSTRVRPKKTHKSITALGFKMLYTIKAIFSNLNLACTILDEHPVNKYARPWCVQTYRSRLTSAWCRTVLGLGLVDEVRMFSPFTLHIPLTSRLCGTSLHAHPHEQCAHSVAHVACNSKTCSLPILDT